MRLRIVGLIFVMLTGFVAVSAMPATGQAVKNPDTYVSIASGDWTTLDYAWAYNVADYTIIFNLYETLISYDGTRTDRFVPKLATSLPSLQNGLLSQGGRTYTFAIRQGVRFHDGTLLTARDVAYSLQRFLLTDRDGGPSTLLLEPILGITSTRADGQLVLRFADLHRAIQVRGNTVVVTLKQPYAPFLSILALFSNIVSQKWAIANGDWDGTESTMARHNNPKREATAFFERANGTGPFKLEWWDRPGRQMIFVRNDDYWRVPARLSRVVLRRVDEVATRILMLKAGDADHISLSRRELPQIQDDPGIRIIDDLVEPVTSALFFFFDIDTRGNPDVGSGQLDGNGIPNNFFADVHVRRGFAYAFDYSTYVADAFRGKARLLNSMIPPMIFGYNPRQPYFTFNRDRATAEFKEAFGGRVWERGFRFTIVVSSGAIVGEIGSRIFKDSVEALNLKFKIDIRFTTPSTAEALWTQSKRTLAWSGGLADYPDPHNFAFHFMHRDGFFPVLQKFRNDDADRLIMQAVRETDRKKREALYHQIGQKYFELVPSIATHNAVGFRAQRAWLRGWYYNPMYPGADWYTLYKQ